MYTAVALAVVGFFATSLTANSSSFEHDVLLAIDCFVSSWPGVREQRQQSTASTVVKGLSSRF